MAEVDGWTFLADPDMRVTFDDEVLEGLSGSGGVPVCTEETAG